MNHIDGQSFYKRRVLKNSLFVSSFALFHLKGKLTITLELSHKTRIFYETFRKGKAKAIQMSLPLLSAIAREAPP